MAIQYVHTIPDGTITVKWMDTGISNEIHLQNTISYILIQDLINACRAAEASPQGVAFPSIASASGKETLGSGVAVGITLLLLGTWRVYSTKSSGDLTVLGGNLVKAGGASPFRSNPSVATFNILSASSTIVTTGGGGGGSFLDADRTKLAEIHAGTAPLVASIYGYVVDGALTLQSGLKKMMAVIFGGAPFSVPAAGESLIEFKDQSGTVESTHHITSANRTVT